MNVGRKPKLELCRRQDHSSPEAGRILARSRRAIRSCAKAELNSTEGEACMIERYRSDRRWMTTERLTQSSQTKGAPDPLRAKHAFETNSSSNQARHPDWTVIALLIFVVFTWAAFAFCIYDIWTRTAARHHSEFLPMNETKQTKAQKGEPNACHPELTP